jgi:hypothetical protein
VNFNKPKKGRRTFASFFEGGRREEEEGKNKK